ncbi:MAG: hypothetical protein AB1896_19200 [Thermodesulfobacteriota bacterium]
MTKLLTFLAALAVVLQRLADWLARQARREEAEEHARQMEAARRDPAGAFLAHFGGGMRPDPGPKAPDPGQAGLGERRPDA